MDPCLGYYLLVRDLVRKGLAVDSQANENIVYSANAGWVWGLYDQ